MMKMFPIVLLFSFRYQCAPSNIANVYVCCYGSTTVPTCANGGTPQKIWINYKYCSTTQPCISPYTCQTATNLANTFVCCSTSTISPSYTCPVNYTPYLRAGTNVFCSSSNPVNCPGGYFTIKLGLRYF